LVRLRYLTLHASGNTLAYSLTSFARLLEVDKGWECVDQELVERVRAQPGLESLMLRSLKLRCCDCSRFVCFYLLTIACASRLSN
jgi:hypothetical protein